MLDASRKRCEQAEAEARGHLEALRLQNREPLDRLRPREEMQVAQPATR